MPLLYACRAVFCSFFVVTLLAFASPSTAYAQVNAANTLPAPGKALVFVFRKDRVALPAPVSAYVNSQKLGQLTNNTYVVASVNPGATKILIGDLALTRLDLVTAPNQRYFVRVDGVFGVTVVRTEIQPASEQEGLRALVQSRLVGDVPQTSAASVAPATPSTPIAASAAGNQTSASSPLPNSATATTVPARPSNAVPRANAATTQAPPSAPMHAAAANSAMPASAPPPPRPASPEAQASSSANLDGHRRFAVSVSTGTFTLASGNQTLAGLSSTFESASKSVLSVHGEWRDASGVAFGGELFSYSNDIATTGSSPDAKQDTVVFMANAKYYLNARPSLRPFAGAGLGLASATYSGSLAGSATGLAYQAFVGAELRLSRATLLLHYKFLTSSVGSPESVSIGGSGILLGVGLVF